MHLAEEIFRLSAHLNYPIINWAPLLAHVAVIRKSRRDEKKTALPSSRPMTRLGCLLAVLALWHFLEALVWSGIASIVHEICRLLGEQSATWMSTNQNWFSTWSWSTERISRDATVDIDVELYKLVHNSDSDIDNVFALLIVLLLRKVWVYKENKAVHCLTMLILFLFW